MIFEKPYASAGVHSPAASPYLPRLTAISECGDVTPSTNRLPGRSCTRTLPVTRACDDDEQRLDVAARGVELLALVDELPVDLAHGLLHDAWVPSSVSFSSSRCALIRISAAGASNATRPFVPMIVSPKWMPRPMP